MKSSRNLSMLMCSLLVAATVAFCQTDPTQGPPSGLGSDCQQFSGEPSSPQDPGQAFIIGQLRKIEDTKLTIRRPDGVEEAIEVDENTKFLDSHGAVITLAEFKIGDQVAGIGAPQHDVFVLAEFREVPTDLGILPF